MGSNVDYERKLVNGIKTIIWNHNPANDSATKEEKKARKAMKEKVGDENRDTPMLDMRMTSNGLQYCDIVITTTELETWTTAICKQYSDHTVIEKEIRGGYQKYCFQLP